MKRGTQTANHLLEQAVDRDRVDDECTTPELDGAGPVLNGKAPSWMPLRFACTTRNGLISGFRYCISGHNHRRRIPFGSFSSPPLVHFTSVRSSNAEISSACAYNGFMIKRLNSACETAVSNRMWVRTVSIGIVVLLYGPRDNVPRATPRSFLHRYRRDSPTAGKFPRDYLINPVLTVKPAMSVCDGGEFMRSSLKPQVILSIE